MKWFRHLVNAHSGSLEEVITDTGLKGYGGYWLLAEIYARACKYNPGEFVELDYKTVCRKLCSKESTVKSLLDCYALRTDLEFVITGQKLKLKIPKMKELCDEWTRKKTSNSGVTSRSYTETEEEIFPDGNIVTAREKPPTGKKSSKKSTKTVVAGDWRPDQNFLDWLRERYPEVDTAEFERELDKFKAYHQSHANKHADHNAALRNWFNSPYRTGGTKAQGNGLRNGSHRRLHGSDIVPSDQRQGGIRI